MKQVKYRGLKGKIIEQLRANPDGLTLAQLTMYLRKDYSFDLDTLRSTLSVFSRTGVLQCRKKKHTCPLCGSEKYLWQLNEEENGNTEFLTK